MLLFSSAVSKHQLTFTRLSDSLDYIPIAAGWAEAEWGYIRNKGVEYRAGVLHALRSDVFIGTYAGQPVAMFALLEHELPNSRGLKTRELTYVYVKKEYRGLGFGKQIIEEAKRLTEEAGAHLILLSTLKPGLNRFYEKHGAKVVCEDRLFSHEIDMLRISV